MKNMAMNIPIVKTHSICVISEISDIQTKLQEAVKRTLARLSEVAAQLDSADPSQAKALEQIYNADEWLRRFADSKVHSKRASDAMYQAQESLRTGMPGWEAAKIDETTAFLGAIPVPPMPERKIDWLKAFTG
ncbi:MAG: hypothetical protein ABSE48_13525 [Verrucomicrobiota bacterium]|jgi:lysyl-tRNA synthetase class I